jgi:NTE family protein
MANNETDIRQGTGNMKIGIALGSGSARGWAHIGVLNQLVEMDIKPDIVAGSSIGSLVGAAYASQSLESFENWVKGLDSKSIFQLLDITWGKGGLIEGKKLFDYFSSNLEYDDIESLPVRYAAVATDMGSGREVWFQEGSVFEAVRASIALPGLFTPAKKDNRWFLDGGIVNPVPVSLCRAMGADIVIAVDLNSDIIGKHLRQFRHPEAAEASGESFFHSPFLEQAFEQFAESLDEESFLSRLFKSGKRTPEPGLYEVIASTVNIMQARITRSRMAGDPPDILISPRLSHIGLMEFDKAEEAIKEGMAAVKRAESALEYLVLKGSDTF